MAEQVIMPKLGLTMRDGKIIKWCKGEGDRVEKGEILFIVETEKVTYEVESPASGILGKILVRESETVPVTEVVAYIIQEGEVLTDSSADVPKKESVREGGELPKKTGAKIKASPLAKRIAEDQGIDIGIVQGTGPDGRITKEDVLKAVEAGVTAPAVPEKKVIEPVEDTAYHEEELIPLDGMRSTIAKRMTESWQTTPHFMLTVETDVSEMKKLRESCLPLVEKMTGERLTYTDFLIKIVAMALQRHPEVNCSWTDAGIRMRRHVNVGLAVAVKNGLIVPVIKDASSKSLSEIAKMRADIAHRASEGLIMPDEMTDGSMTITNLGMFGIDHFIAVINPPESCILSVGRMIEKALVVDGEIQIRPTMTFVLSIDHRVVDGATGSRFLQDIKNMIENPILMSL